MWFDWHDWGVWSVDGGCLRRVPLNVGCGGIMNDRPANRAEGLKDPWPVR